MTLNTAIYVHDPIDIDELWGIIIGIVVPGDREPEVIDRPSAWETGGRHRLTVAGQGLRAWTHMHYNPEGARRPEPEPHSDDCDDPCEYQHEPAHFARLNLDTGYGYQDSLGRCSELHARCLFAFSDEMEKRGIAWSWRNEYSGEVFQGLDGVGTLLKNGEDAMAWYASIKPLLPGEES